MILRAVVFLFLLLLCGFAHAQSAKGAYYLHQSQIYLDQEKYHEAKLYADSALIIATLSNSMDSLERAHLLLYEVHIATRDFEKALHDFKMAAVYRDSIDVLKHRAKEQALTTSIEQEKKAHLIDVEVANSEITRLKETAVENWRNTLILLVGMLALSGIVTFTYYRRKVEMQESLAKAKAEVEKLNSFKDKLFAVLSYDLENAVSSFENLTQSLAGQINKLNKEETIQYLLNLHNTAGDLKGTLNNVIHWVAYQANSKPFNPESFDGKSLTEQIVDRFRTQSAERNLTFTVFMPDGQRVFADKEMVGIIMENLISNAVNFTTANGAITCFSGQKDGLVMMGVKDSGIGISEENINKLFSTKENSNSISKSSRKGAGIGLILCKDLVERNGGRLHVESSVGQGSTFYFTLPERQF